METIWEGRGGDGLKGGVGVVVVLVEYNEAY